MSKREDEPKDDATDGDDEDQDDGFCRTCGGSGGGHKPFQCTICGGTGRSWVHDQERIDHENEIRREMAIDRKLEEG